MLKYKPQRLKKLANTILWHSFRNDWAARGLFRLPGCRNIIYSPCAIMASDIFLKAAISFPAIRSYPSPYSSAAAAEAS